VKLYDFAHHPDFCGNRFTDSSWDGHRVIWRLYDGDGHLLDDAQREVAYQFLGVRRIPTAQPSEIFIGAGRRCGKTTDNALFAVHAAARNHQKPEGILDPGQWATAACICPNRKQAKEWLDACAGIIENSRLLASEVARKTDDTIEFNHGSRLTVLSSNFKTVRSYTLSFLVLDEAAFLQEEGMASPDKEIYVGARSGLRTLKGPLVVTSSLHRKTGLMYEKFLEHYGKVA
jgi:hypothetical protein